MSTPFKMKGWSPFHQEEKRKVTPGKEVKDTKVKDTKVKKYRLSKGTRKNTSTGETVTDYFKIDSEGNKTKISEASYNSMKGQ